MIRWPEHANVVVANQLFTLMAHGDKADFAIDGYPEYGTEANNLEPLQKDVLRRAADVIVRSHSTMSPIRAFLVIGHADKALRKPVNERAAFELQVSQQRAKSASEALFKEVNRLAAGTHFAKTLQHGALGVGNKRPLVPSASSEAEMKKNRRIEILFGRCQLSPPRCGV